MDAVIIEALRQDLSAGTERFREELLQRCLEVLGVEPESFTVLDDEDLELLAAAGIPSLAQGGSPLGTTDSKETP